ncbi:trans-sialidase, putative, partial [Trypanosoma cruzi marinkellei]
RVFTSAVLLLFVVWMCGSAGSVQAQNYGAGVGYFYGRDGSGPLLRGHPVANTPAAGHIFLNPHLVNVNGTLLAIAGALFSGSVGSQGASMKLMAKISNDSGVTWQNYTEPGNSAVSASGSRQIPPLVTSETFNPFLAFVEGYDLMYGVKPHYAVERGRSGLESVIHFLETGPGKDGNLSMNSASMSIRFPYPPQSGGVIGFLNDASSLITKMEDNTLVFPVQFLTLGGDAASTIMYRSSGQQPWILGK